MGLWKQIFGESQAESWARLAQEIGGVNVEPGWARSRQVHARIGGFDIVLDTYTVSTGKSQVTYTRLRAPFVNARGLRFGIHRASIFTGIAKALGKQDIEIGVPEFDRDFVIQGNDEARVKAILGDPSLRAMIIAQPRIHVSIVDDEGLFGQKYGHGVDILTFVETGIIKDVPRLRGLFSMLGAMLHAFRDGARHFLEVPTAELPASYFAVIENIAETVGGVTERVGEGIESRIPDPLGLDVNARFTMSIPALPALTSTFKMEGTLPPSSATFSVEKRGLIARGAFDTGDKHIDDALAIRGDAAHVKRVLRALSTLAPLAPTVDVSTEGFVVDIKDIPADRAPGALAASLDMWQEIARARVGAD